MYEFRDVHEASESVVLPSEALQINGEYIENLISGYRTLNVKGREALSPDVTSFETGVRDGSTLQGKRYPERIITVTYQLIAQDDAAFREAYNQLGKILDVKNAILIFNDEIDKYFVGTPCIIGDVKPGANAVVGNFEILCTDPFKYSVMEYEATASEDGSILVDYNGTYKSYPVLEADFYSETEVAEDGETAGTLTGAGDCGYVAFFNEEEKIIQLGDPAEIDGDNTAEKSQTLMNQLFTGQYAWGTTAKALWSVNNGIVIPELQQMGNVGMVGAYKNTAVKTKDTKKTILGVLSSGKPGVYYNVTASTSKRTASSVYVEIIFGFSLMNGTGAGISRLDIKAEVYVAGEWRSVTIRIPVASNLMNTRYTKSIGFTVSGIGATATALAGIKFRASCTNASSIGKITERNCEDIPVSTYSASSTTVYYLTPSSYGTASGWHGPTITRNIGADASGAVGAANFTLTYKQRMCIGNSRSAIGQLGAFQANIIDEEGVVLAGVRIHKNLSGNKQASLLFYVNGVKVYGTMVDMSYNNKRFGSTESAVQTSTIAKSGSKISFNIAGIQQTFTDATLAEKKAVKVTFAFESYSAVTALAYNGLYWAKFVKNNCSTWKEIPNKFSANDILEADCKNAEIYLNGVNTPGLGAIGNDWEAFYLTPGLNQIGISYSEWVTAEYAPTVKVRYREVFL